MTALHKLIELTELNRKLDPYYEGVKSEESFELVIGEVNEAKEEFDKKDYSELEKEIGDIYWNLLILTNKLEDEGKINKEKAFESIYNKMSLRKTFLLEGRKVDKEEAMIIWNDAKRKEGYEESRLWNK
ncbi:MAG: MazG nucleotide pyrophosphohydrolase domain-containing protein [Candidatus Gracilibacteria bacterium]|nr:MazG nucleotide pyrophosphohydrolase domain-containing protein [Candidatus Gracilibacteria bacterium]MDD2908182.1 MazG nucleotide pyrophosphohydrolase domain-containing protein [Candidatus Gracilibacteria bacterium]